MPFSQQATGQFLLAAKAAEIHSLENLADTCLIVDGASHLIHNLQRERGLSNIFLVSQGSRLATQRQEQVVLTRKQESDFWQLLQRHYLNDGQIAVPSRLLSSAAFVFQGLNELDMLRQQIDAIQLDPTAATHAFSRLVAGILAFVFEAADSAGDPRISQALVALMNFMQGKEYAGQERAWGAMGFANGRFDQPLMERLINLRSAQERAFRIFAQYVDPKFLQNWSLLEQDQSTQQLQQLRAMVDRLQSSDSLSPELSEVWYQITTQRIDGMRELESQLSKQLLSVSQQSIRTAQQQLNRQKERIDELAIDSTPSALSLLLQMEVPIVLGAGGATLHTQPATGEEALPLSVYDLLREQAEHLTRIKADLHQAREALAERKLVEKAKGLLMKHMNLSEEQAYRRIQQKAMESNLRLAEVCEILIEAAAKSNPKTTK